MKIPAIGIFRMPAAYRLADADTTNLNPQTVRARTEPAWCNDCMPGNELTVHSYVVGSVTDVVNGERFTVQVRVERADRPGSRGEAYVSLLHLTDSGPGNRVDFGPAASLRLADLYGQAAQMVLADRANGGLL